MVRRRWRLRVAVAFIRAVHNVDKLVRIEPGGFGVPAGARRVPGMSGAPRADQKAGFWVQLVGFSTAG